MYGAGGKLLGHVASRAHHSDVGGSTPGSMPLAQEIFEEGIRIPPVRLYEKGQLNIGLWNTLLANVRTPVERAGDLDAQVAALHSGQKRLCEIAQRRGTEATLTAMTQLIEYADRLVEAGLAMVPDGFYEAEDWIEDDGFGSGPIPIRASLHVEGAKLTVDFEGTSPQVPGGVNAVAAITSSATRYVVRCIVEALLKEPLPAGGGSMSVVKLILPPKSVVNADPPASVAAGNGLTGDTITNAGSLSHGNTSSQESLTALTGANVVSDIDLDTYGHVTNLATRAISSGNGGLVPTQGTTGHYLSHNGSFAQVNYSQLGGTPPAPPAVALTDVKVIGTGNDTTATYDTCLL